MLNSRRGLVNPARRRQPTQAAQAFVARVRRIAEHGLAHPDAPDPATARTLLEEQITKGNQQRLELTGVWDRAYPKERSSISRRMNLLREDYRLYLNTRLWLDELQKGLAAANQ